MMGNLKTKLQRPEVSDPEKEREDWRQLLDELVHKVKGWLPEGWTSLAIEKEMEDSQLGEYKAPALLMQLEFTRVMMEPMTRFAPGTDGVVDLYKMPAYDNIASLYRIKGEWKLHYTFRGSKPVTSVRSADSLPLDETNLLRVLEEFAGHAA
jgi:hypothetical protein